MTLDVRHHVADAPPRLEEPGRGDRVCWVPPAVLRPERTRWQRTWPLLAGIVALTLLAGPAMRLAEAAAVQLHDPAAYLGAVLHGQEGTK